MGEFDENIGFTLVGVILNTYLTGVIMSQFFTYWTTKYQDRIWIKVLVGFLFLVNASQAIAVAYMSWWYCVKNFNNPDVVKSSLWPYPFTAVGTAILALVNQAFQSWRIYVFTKNKPLIILLLVLGLASFATGIAAAILAWLTIGVLAKLHTIGKVVETNLSLQCFLDIVIAAILSVIFTRSKTDIAKTDRILDRLIRTAVQSGTFTAICAIGNIFAFRFSPTTHMLALFALPIGRIYTHTMMDHFISRGELRNILNSGDIVTVPAFNVTSVAFNNGTAGNTRITTTTTNGGGEAIMMNTSSKTSSTGNVDKDPVF